MSSKILAIDTVTEGCSAALLVGDEVVERFEITPRGHTQRILPMVDELLSEAALQLTALDAIAFDRGPGSFTGLRITAGVVQGLAYGASLPVIPVSSLAALAFASYRENQNRNILAAIDARMGEVYCGYYQINNQSLPELIGEESVLPPNKIKKLQGPWVGVGSGFESYREELKEHLGENLVQMDGDALPHAKEIARLALHEFECGRVLSPEEAQPVYLRNQVVHHNSEL
ncbi:MAG: tRNA (adenosine(37)-N6)-threonylcarbamoyltransferase complex dimerization subunit type 1 TsaB [Gammaproteobacteria bacterium]|uniref:tRNA threonylcarbamoyladenosine biosynthesis protein TsaB n=1 Tax=Candidatus Thiopontia autotrophica TaxID=2841688 RepID=A0A8J6P8U7_9GAMM|nr:tRNA (adenosine(37)-N6)-threonylcarbamoyltransferase complex dimerization subunit type 1 TsaB [Candidatus Thiopontia autotrophica]MBL6969144.1 tRNA (adenosine(37)-N6)-threonylcarbamoyltransferase complex dimerization subunit type 1 TsaB [Gammaproteobacteria bacterium]